MKRVDSLSANGIIASELTVKAAPGQSAACPAFLDDGAYQVAAWLALSA